MDYLFKGSTVYTGQKLIKADILIKGGIVSDIGNDIQCDGAFIFDFTGKYIFPGFTDVHVHLREPGFSYKETVKTGTAAAAAGGYTTVLTMPNLKPCPDTLEKLKVQLDIIERDAEVNVIPFGTITRDESGAELSDMEDMAPFVAGFSDDGRGVQSGEMMKAAMEKAKTLEKIISAHCEVNELLFGGYIHDGEYAKAQRHRGICSESEWKMIERDIALAKETGCAYHVCHISTKESVDLIRRAKAGGVDISCETAPHYLTMNDSMLMEDGRFKMNPPIRSEADRQALVEGVLDGTIDCLATDHAPHSKEEKGKGLEKSLMGVVGLETAFAVTYTELVRPGIIPLEKLLKLLTVNPERRFGVGAKLQIGESADLTVFDLEEEYVIESKSFRSMGKATPFEGKRVFGKCLLTMCGGKTVFKWEEENA